MSRRDLWREVRWNKQRCGYRIVSIDSEASIKVPDDWPRHAFSPQSFSTSESSLTAPSASQAPDTATSSGATGAPSGETHPNTTQNDATWPSQGPQPQLACCYRSTSRRTTHDGCQEGRPLRALCSGAPLLASLAPGPGWVDPQDAREALPNLDHLSASQRDAMAREWSKIAVHEHASIAAFAHLSLELIRYAAPAELIATCHACMQDELRHARLAIRWASHLRGEPLAPGPVASLASRPTSENLTQLALSNLEEGCCNETLATLIMLDRANRYADPEMQKAIRGIAIDEQRHAQFAWRLNQWFLEQEPALWPVLNERMQSMLEPTLQRQGSHHEAKGQQIAQQELLDLARVEVLLPLWDAIRAQASQHHPVTSEA